MKFMIHAIPQRMWYVEGFLLPALREQGATEIAVWNDTEHKGNLRSCMDSFKAMEGDGGTWHLQDDVIVCRDFVKRCADNDEGLVYGFCCRNFNDRLEAYGEVYVPDAWNSFQCVRIPNEYARDCAEWVLSKAWQSVSPIPELQILFGLNKGDDTFFHEYMICCHPYETALNLKPNLVDHIDFLVGGSSLHWRDYIARAEYFEDLDLIEEMKHKLNERG